MMAQDFLIDPATRLGHVHYTINDIDRQIAFYEQALRMQLHWRKENQAALGAGGEDLVILSEDKSAQRVLNSTGMYHFALLYPDRRELARAIARLFDMGYRNSPTDHVISKTTYLDDPEGNNIELYCYSLEDGSFETVDGQWKVRYADGRPSSGRDPLDLQALFSHLGPGDDLYAEMPKEVMIGHVHIYGNDLAGGMRFYSEVLGFKYGNFADRIGFADVELERPHVIAWNVWQGPGAQSPPKGSLGIRYFTIDLPNAKAMKALKIRLDEAGWDFEESDQLLKMKDPAGVAIHIKAINA